MNKKILKDVYCLVHNQGIKPGPAGKILSEKYGVCISEWYIKKKMKRCGFKSRDLKEKYTEREKRLIAKLYENCYDINLLIDYLNTKHNMNLTVYALQTLTSRMHIRRKRQPVHNSTLNYNQIRQLVREYESGQHKTVDLMKKYGFKTENSIHQKVKNYGGKMRTAQVSKRLFTCYDENIFERIDEEWKAYFLGLLLTDGYVASEKGTVGIDLVDRETISYLSDKTGKGSSEIVGKRENVQTKYRIVFTSRKMAQDLKRLSVVDRKSLTLQGPNLYNDEVPLVPFILKGIIDGDGWIRKDGKEFFICSGSYDFLVWCKSALEDLGMTSLKVTKKTFENRNWNPIYHLRTAIQGNMEILKSKVYCYDIGMTYKRDKLFQEGRSETTTGAS